MITRLAIAVVSLFSASLVAPAVSDACSRAGYFGKDGQTKNFKPAALFKFLAPKD